ncbi:hypothetical protein [Brucella sp. 22210]|uniref:hypothetical protein n=1 Tax=Brucella sp. 22210 TaxID=3453892 RepID=UPI003F8446A2
MGMFVRIIGIARATMKIGMVNLAYNISRYVWHEKKAAIAWGDVRPAAMSPATWRHIHKSARSTRQNLTFNADLP